MPPARSDAIPVEALRDLLGIVRAVFAAWSREKASPVALEELRGIGAELSAALRLAQRSQPDTLGHAAAWSRAERATEALGKLIQETTPIKPALDAAVSRIFVAQSARPSPTRPSREEVRRQRRLRS